MGNENFKKIPLGKAKDLSNQTFGYLTPLYRIENDKNAKTKWACQCECGNIIGVISSDLISGHTKSCGCQKAKMVSKSKVISEVGNKYGRLTVLERAGSDSERRAIWKCQCECGNICYVTGKNLRLKHTTSCGCYNKEINAKRMSEIASNNYIDEIGNRYGKLTVIEKVEIENKSFGGTVWKCLCDCGNIKITKGQYLRNGMVSSCGCLTISKGELFITNILQKNNIKFKPEYCININNIKYRYDFAILNENEQLQYIIEFDGKQHFQSVEYFGGDEYFKNIQNNDIIKNNYCKENNIPLIRIPYTHLNELCLEDLLLETSQFII